MPTNRAAMAVTDRYRRQLVELRDGTADAQARRFLDMIDLDASPEDLNRALARWLTGASSATSAAARQAHELTVRYLNAYLVASGGRPMTAKLPTPAPNVAMLGTVRGSLLTHLGRGAGREVALASARAAVLRGTREVIGRTAAASLQQGIRLESQIAGWERATSSRCCKRCADLAGKVYRDDDAFARHPVCRCSMEPVLRGKGTAVTRPAPEVVERGAATTTPPEA